MGPTLPVSVETQKMKYLLEGETHEQGMSRIAFALKDDQPHYNAFREVLIDQRFMPGGRVQSAMGAPKVVTPYNCFVSGTIDDSFTDGTASIMARATEAAQTMRLGGGIGYDFSTLRPRGDLIRKLGSQASGPISFMDIYDAICRTVASSGHRRGAQMAVLRVDHPDIFEFVYGKQPRPSTVALWQHVEAMPAGPERDILWQSLQKTLPLQGFNISVAVTDEFMECLIGGRPFTLKFGGNIVREIDAAELWDAIMKTTWDWAEPGVIFIDQINRMNNLWYCETIAATNPCGEQPLPPHGACLLGSFNVVKYLNKSRDIDLDQLARDIPAVVRAMDNVVDRAEYPLPQQGREARAKRRMGLGVTGLANAIEASGKMRYGDPAFIAKAEEVLATINHHAYLASVELAREKGSFAMLDRDRYLDSGFMKSMDREVRRAIKKHGIRNSHLTSIAPTGTISLCADNISSGIEPVFSHAYARTIQTFDGPIVETIEDYGVRVFGVRGKTANEVTVEEHVNVLCAAQKHVDSAVSKTCNVGDSVTFDEFQEVYRAAWEGGAKGLTTFRAAGKRMGILVAKDEAPVEEGAACRIDPVTGARSCE